MNETVHRAETDWTELQELASRAGFWSVTPLQDLSSAARQFKVRIEGRAIASGGPSASRVEFTDEVLIDVELPADYPAQPPRCRVTTPVFHPNIPADGVIELRELRIDWQPKVGLDVVLERIWDALRGVLVDLEHPLNIGAGQWYAMQTAAVLPVDLRPLVTDPAGNPNIVLYRRRGEPRREMPPTERLIIDAAETDTTASPIHIIE